MSTGRCTQRYAVRSLYHLMYYGYKTGIRWCLVGDILLIHYNVPKIMGARTNLLYMGDHLDVITEQDIEICVPFEDLHKVQDVFNTESDFCFPFRPGRSYYNGHLAQYPRFNVSALFLTPITVWIPKSLMILCQ